MVPAGSVNAGVLPSPSVKKFVVPLESRVSTSPLELVTYSGPGVRNDRFQRSRGSARRPAVPGHQASPTNVGDC